MSTWTEFEQPLPPRQRRTKPVRRALSFTEHWQSFNDRRGTGAQTFGQRLSRARLLYLRRDENGANWLALCVLCALVSLPSLISASNALPHGDTSAPIANRIAFLQSIAA